MLVLLKSQGRMLWLWREKKFPLEACVSYINEDPLIYSTNYLKKICPLLNVTLFQNETLWSLITIFLIDIRAFYCFNLKICYSFVFRSQFRVRFFDLIKVWYLLASFVFPSFFLRDFKKDYKIKKSLHKPPNEKRLFISDCRHQICQQNDFMDIKCIGNTPMGHENSRKQ